jgi:polyisoprenoid-binding protein YceI
VSTRVESTGEGTAKVYGNLTLKDVTREVVIDAELVGMGADPWGGERAGFEGTTKFALTDFNIMKNLGPLSQDVEMILSVEGIKKK